LLEEAWGWQRLLPYRPSPVGWPAFKEYLKDYFRHNMDEAAVLCAHQKPDPVGHVDPADALRSAVSLCLKMENNLLENCLGGLSAEDIELSCAIKERARNMIQSGGESRSAAAGF
ncbi:hypothetical protein EJB05_47013, partial [Eragrostis curvula]